MPLEWTLHAIEVSPTKRNTASQKQSGAWENQKG